MVARPIFGVLDTRIDREGAGPGFWNEVLEDHRRICAAIERRDEDAAAQSMWPTSNFSGSATPGSIDSARSPGKTDAAGATRAEVPGQDRLIG